MTKTPIERYKDPEFDIDIYLSGKKLFGDDFSLEHIQAWYKDEEVGYSSIINSKTDSYAYMYHSLNRYHGFSFLDGLQFRQALGFGSAFGDEFLPIQNQIENLTILDAGKEQFETRSALKIKTTYEKPASNGEFPFPCKTFDLILCLGVLHHIPNVSFVVGELLRVLKKGGFLIIREPVVSMGDWRNNRCGLTANERGIPLWIFRNLLTQSDLTMHKLNLCCFPPLNRLCKKISLESYNNPFLVRLDYLLSKIFAWNYRYHAKNFWQKIRPVSAFAILEKR